MGTLYFKVASDYQEVIRLREEIDKLKQSLQSIDKGTSPQAITDMENKLSAASDKMHQLISDGAKAYVDIENKVRDAAKSFDLSNSASQLKAFDGELLKMTDNLNKYFTDLLSKGEALSSLLQSGKTATESVSPSTQGLDEIKAKNAELTEQLAKQKEEIKQQQEEWNKLATAIKSNNIGALDQYKQSMGASAETVRSAKSELKSLGKDLDENIQYYEKLTVQAAAYKEELARLQEAKDKGMTRVVVGEAGTSRLINDEIEEMSASLKEARENQKGVSSEIAVQQKRQAELNTIVEQGNEKHARTRTLIMNGREQLIQMRAAGLQNTIQYQQASEELGKMRRQMVLVNKEMEFLANPNKGLTVLKAGFSGAATSASLAMGVIGLFNDKSEKMVELQTKIQSLMAIIIGLEGTYGMLKKSSTMMLGIEYIQRKAIIASMALENKVKAENVALTLKETIAQTAFNLVAKTNPYVLLATAILSVVGGVALLISANKESTDVQKKTNEMAKEAKEIQDAYTKSVASNAASQMASYQRMRSEYNQLGDNLEKRKKFIVENKDAFQNLGFSIKGVSDAERLFNGQTNAVVESIMARAKATAAASIAQDNYKNMFERMGQLELHKRNSKTMEQMAREAAAKQGYNYDKAESGIKEQWIESIRSQYEAQEAVKAGLENGVKDLRTASDSYIRIGSVYSQKEDSILKKAGIKGYNKNVDKSDRDAEKLHKKQKEALEKNNEDLLALRRKNQQQEAGLMEESTEKKLALIKADYDAQAQEIEKREKEFAKRNKESSIGGLNAKGLTKEQQDEIDKANKLNVDNRKKQESEAYKLELQSMRDYLKEYGTFQQQKLAIAEEYNEKIAKATDEWQKKNLTAERDAKITGVEVNAIKQSVDWGSVFGDFGTIFKDQLQPTIDKLRAISNTDEFRTSPLQDQQILYDLIKKLEQSNAAWDSDIFKRVSDDMNAYQAAMRDNINALDRQANAEKALASARENLKRVEAAGEDTTQAKIDVQQAQTAFNDASEDVLKFGSKVKETTSNLESSTAKAINMFRELEGGFRGLTSGSLKGVGDGLMQLDKLFSGNLLTDKDGGLTAKLGNTLAKGFQSLLGKDSAASKTLNEALGSTGMAGEIISAVLGILDVIGKVGISGIITSLQDTVFNSVEKMLDDVLSGDIIVQPVKNAFKHVGNILNTLTFGGFKSWTNNSNAKEVAETTSRLTSSNEILTQSIDALKDEMEKARGADTVKVYDEAVKKQKELIENTGDILAAQMGYHSSHHSNDYYINDSLSSNDWQRISDKVGSKVTDTSDLWNLSPEDLKKVSTLTDIWDKIYNGGKYDKSDYIDQYLKLAGTLEQLETQLQETLTQTTFDEVYDNFVNTLMDMNKSASDFANDLSKVFMKAMLSNMIGQEYAKKLEAWYKKFADDMEDGTLDDKEREALKDEYMSYVNAAIKERDELAKTIGYTSDSSSSQSATSKGYEIWSETDAKELNGRFTALQIAGEAIRVQGTEQTTSLRDVSGKMGEVLVLNTDIRNIADDTRNILASTFLETVEIKENTGLAARYLKDIKSDIADVKVNTKAMAG